MVGVEWRIHEAHPEVCDLQEPVALILRAEQAARFGDPKRQGQLSAPSTNSAQGITLTYTQNLHPWPDERSCRAEAGTAPSPSAARFQAGYPGTVG